MDQQQTSEGVELEEITKLYQEGEEVDKELFAEMRSNILLISGNHYTKRSSTFSNIRSSKSLSDQQKIRITQNHIYKIKNHYENTVIAHAPGVAVRPQNELEMRDRKSAELNQAVWSDAKSRYNLAERTREWASEYVGTGECAAYIYFDASLGAVKGHEQALDEQGVPLVDELGNPVPDQSRPVMEGQFVFKTIYGWNLLRTGTAQQMRTAPVVTMREMVDRDELARAFQNDEEKMKLLPTKDHSPFVIFDATKQSYESGDQVLLRYTFYRSSKRFQNGWYVISTELGIIEQGELPFGIWPIAWKGFDVYSSNPRGYSIIKVARPFQAEINRAASQMAQHQISVGDDKVLYQAGTKLAPGALIPGVRGITFQGVAPQILPGRDGGQFAPYIEKKILEMYDACNMAQIAEENATGQLDPYALIFRAASQAQKNKKYTEGFEEFLRDVCTIYLELCKHYLPDDALIQATGKSEYINIAEFRNTQPLSYQIKVEAQTETAESKLGRQLTLTNVLQYVGNQLDKKQIGAIMKEMPFLNNKALFKRLTVDYDNAENDMMALERGQLPEIPQYCENTVYIEALTNRMKQADFNILPPAVRQAYSVYLQGHEKAMAEKAQAMEKAKAGFIPVDGALITCSMHLPDPENPGKTKQVRLPYSSINWLVEKLEGQGQGLEQLEAMNKGVVSEMMQNFMGQQALPQQGMPPQGMLPQFG